MKKIFNLSFILSLTIFVLYNINAQANIKEYFISCNPDDFKYIYENFEEDTSIPIVLEYENKIWGNASMRIRGDGSRIYPKKSLKIKFADKTFINDRNEINLNADYLDLSYMRQFLASKIFQKLEYPCFDVEHIRVYLNGEFLVLYVQIESVDFDFLKNRGFDPNGNMYKAAIDWASLNLNDKSDYWEKKTNLNSGMDDLFELIWFLNTVPDELYEFYANKLFDLDKMITIIAVNMLLANGSTYYHNYYMYNDLNYSNKWMMIPWDLDKTFCAYSPEYAYNQSTGLWIPDNPFLDRAISNPNLFNLIKNKVNEISEKIFNKDFLFPIIDSLKTVLKPSIEQDTTDMIKSLSDWYYQIDCEKYFIQTRLNRLNTQFQTYPLKFKVDKNPHIYKDKIKFTWHQSLSPMGNKIKYRLSVTPVLDVNDPEAVIIDNIEDTTYTMDVSSFKERQYHWIVEAFDSNKVVLGYDDRNDIQYKKATKLPCEINENTILKKDKSPYYTDCHLVITPNTSLTLEAGVELRVGDSTKVIVMGNLNAFGTKQEPVKINRNFDTDSTAMIWFVNSTNKCHFNNVHFRNSIILSENAHLIFDSCLFNIDIKIPVTNKVIYGFYGSLEMRSCTFWGNNTGEGNVFIEPKYAKTENCVFYNLSDCMEYINCYDGYIKNNSFFLAGDDAIDLNACKNIEVTNNRIYFSKDKGISIGTESTGLSENILVKRNLIVACNIGIGLKNQTTLKITNNTFYKNNNSIHCYEKEAGLGGANIIVENTIFSQCKENDIILDSLSSATVSYSLSDKNLNSGIGNIFANPKLVTPESDNYNLKSDSPCINAGNPESDPDTDSSRNDIGAFPFLFSNDTIVINEINYNSHPQFDPDDWVELYNPHNRDLDLSFWYITDEKNDNVYVFPDGTRIESNGFLVLVKDLQKFSQQFPYVNNKIGSFIFGLNASGDMIRIFNKFGKLVDSVLYDDKSPWPEEPDGNGPTLELINPILDNSLPQSWAATKNYGTPGEKNSRVSDIQYPDSHIVNSKFQLTSYPNPFNSEAKIRFKIQNTGYVRLICYNSIGYKIEDLMNEQIEAEEYIFKLTPKKLSNGIYYITLYFDGQTETIPIIYLK